jgi:glycerol-3-phosphate dehydrogenase
MVSGVRALEQEGALELTCKARVVINATGVFTDAIRRMDDPEAAPMIRPSQGVHLVLDGSFLPGDSAIMVPHTDDGRVLFVIPWHGRAVVGTTDTPVDAVTLEPRPFEEELDFLITHAVRFLTKDPAPGDILSAFAGLRPLVSAEGSSDTAALSRDHTLHLSRTGLLTITGGKWTTYRKMAEDTVDQAALVASLVERPSVTADLHLHGWHPGEDDFGDLAGYGADAPAVKALLGASPADAQPIHPALPYRLGEARWAVRNEMARTVEDVLARRMRALLLDARASIAAAPEVARVMAEELGHTDAWITEQVSAYEKTARGYLPFG